jgi:hypothetical protein
MAALWWIIPVALLLVIGVPIFAWVWDVSAFTGRSGSSRTRSAMPDRVALALGIGLSLAVGMVVGLGSPRYAIVLPLAFIGLSIAGIIWCVKSRPLGWLDPMIWMLFPLAIQLGVRPIAEQLAHVYNYRGYYLRPAYATASGITLVGLVGLFAGYLWRGADTLASKTPRMPGDADDRTVVRSTWVLAALAVGGYGLFAAKAGLSFSTLISSGLPSSGASTAYFSLAPQLAVPASLLVMYQGLNRRNSALVLLSVVISGSLVLVEGSAGNRFFALFYLGALLLYVILRYRWRPPGWLITVGIVVAILFSAATANSAPSAEKQDLASSFVSAATHPARSAKLLALGATLEEFDGLAVETRLIPSTLPFHPLTSLTSVLAGPIPRSLWPSKPRYPDGLFDAQAFSVNSGAASVALTMFGGFFYDSGVLGVLIGGILIGVGLRFIGEYLRRGVTEPFDQMALAGALPLVVFLSRGNLGATLSQALFVLLPLPVIAYLARRRDVGRALGRRAY